MIFFILIAITLILVVFHFYVKLSIGVCKSKKSMEGKVIVVTGANSGIGFETAKDLARRNGRVILACRDEGRGTKAAEQIINATGNKNVVFRQLDLSSLESVRKFAAAINESEERLDVLVHNAGIIHKPGLHLTQDNLELHFATNHFGPFLLNHLLLDLLKESAPSRIVVVSSLAYIFANLDLDNINCEKSTKRPMLIYADTKMANILFTKELARKLKGTDVTVNALHPGIVKTDLARNAGWFVKYVMNSVFYYYMKSSEIGAQTSIYLAVSEEVENISGRYFSDCRAAWTSPLATRDKAKQLWKLSVKLTGI